MYRLTERPLRSTITTVRYNGNTVDGLLLDAVLALFIFDRKSSGVIFSSEALDCVSHFFKGMKSVAWDRYAIYHFVFFSNAEVTKAFSQLYAKLENESISA